MIRTCVYTIGILLILSGVVAVFFEYGAGPIRIAGGLLLVLTAAMTRRLE